MSIFSEQVLKLLNDYKRLLKRYLATNERENTILKLGIKRKSLKSDNDVILFSKAHRVLEDIEYWSSKAIRVATEYSGVDEYYQHLKKYLENYQIENNAIVHVTQRVSCALVQAIQLIALPSSDSNVSKLDDCISTVAKFGTKDQRVMLAKALHAQTTDTNSVTIYSPILDNFVKNNVEQVQSFEDQPFGG